MIDYSLLQEIKSKVNIVDIISNYIKLEKKSNEYVGLCPFHQDNNPSLQVSPSKQIFKCFSCNVSGDVFGFVRKYENISFIDAVKKVCELGHIPLPDSLKTRQKIRKFDYEYKVIEKLTSYYEYMLDTNSGKAAKEYLIKRGLDSDTIKHFHIGYASKDQLASINYLRQKENVSVDILQKLGLVNSINGEFKDRYYDRIIFPISSLNSSIVGFSARKYAIDDNSDAKYINSIDSYIFKKGDLLYNLNNAITEIKRTRVIYIVEGFMDVIACFKAGINNVVGLMGTSLSSQHISFIKSNKLEVRLFLDNDVAGQNGIEKAIYQLSENNIQVNIVKPLDDCKDPDEAIFKHGNKYLLNQLNSILLPTSFLLNKNISEGKLITYQQKEEFLLKIKSIYFNSVDISKKYIIDELSSKLMIDGESIKNILLNYLPNKKVNVDNKVNNIINNSKSIKLIDESKLKNLDCKTTLKQYIEKHIINNDSRFKNKSVITLVNTEIGILMRLVKSYNFYVAYSKYSDTFAITELDNVKNSLIDFYQNLTTQVYFICENDLINIINNLQLQLEQIDNSDYLYSLLIHSINILLILKCCKYQINIDDSTIKLICKKLVENHIQDKIKLDIEGKDNTKEIIDLLKLNS